MLSNIQTIDITNSGDASVTLGLLNATGTTSITNDGSLGALTFSNVGAGATTVGVQNTTGSTTVNYASTTGSQTVGLNLAAVGSSSTNATVTIAGVETVNVTSSEATNYAALALDSATALTIAGSANLTVADLNAAGTKKVSSIDASEMTGN